MEEELKKLLAKTQRIVFRDAEIQAERRKHGDFFNIFSVLNVETKETRHSAFIAELLNPAGSHGQKYNFLRLFLEEVEQISSPESQAEKHLVSLKDINLQSAKIRVEEDFGIIQDSGRKKSGGRADIVIHLQKKDGQDFVIVIENKIYAGDQKSQLARYKESVMKEYHNCEIVLVYLTLDGHAPSDDSLQGIDKKSLLILSYHENIKKWLEACLMKAVLLPSLREAIAQYINIINKLTYQEMDKTMSDEMTEMLLEGNNYELALNIKGELENAKKRFFKEWLIKNIFEKIQLASLSFKKDAYEEPTSNEFSFGIFEKENFPKIEFGFLWNNYRDFAAIIRIEDLKNLSDNQKQKLCEIPNSKSEPWAWTAYISGFRNFNDIIIASLLKDSSALKNSIETLLNQIVEAINS